MTGAGGAARCPLWSKYGYIARKYIDKVAPCNEWNKR